MANKEVISIIFRVINFVAIAWLIKYVFQKIQLPVVREKLAEKFAFFKSLETQRKDLIDQNLLLAKEIKDQDNLFKRLKNKITLWNKARKNQSLKLQDELEQINSYHKKRIDIQEQNINQQKLIQEIFPRVIEGTTKQLEQKFSEEKKSKNFLKDIINHMKEIQNKSMQ